MKLYVFSYFQFKLAGVLHLSLDIGLATQTLLEDISPAHLPMINFPSRFRLSNLPIPIYPS
jgi:hypothetical protein